MEQKGIFLKTRRVQGDKGRTVRGVELLLDGNSMSILVVNT